MQIADILGSAKEYQDFSNVITLKKQCYRIISEKQPLTVKNLKINGKDLMEIGIQPGVKMGQILSDLLEKVLENPELNNKEILLDLVKEGEK